MNSEIKADGLVSSPVLDLGTVAAFHMIKGNKQASTYKVEWQVIETPSQIVGFKPDCGCTADCKKVGDKIIADFTPGTTGTFEKGITVFLDDNKPLKLTNAEGVEYYNMEKTHFRVLIKGNYV